MVSIDGSENKMQAASALIVQSQIYNDYKSSPNLRNRVGCTPDGSNGFTFELNIVSMSNKELIERSGFYSLWQEKLDYLLVISLWRQGLQNPLLIGE